SFWYARTTMRRVAYAANPNRGWCWRQRRVTRWICGKASWLATVGAISIAAPRRASAPYSSSAVIASGRRSTRRITWRNRWAAPWSGYWRQHESLPEKAEKRKQLSRKGAKFAKKNSFVFLASLRLGVRI